MAIRRGVCVIAKRILVRRGNLFGLVAGARQIASFISFPRNDEHRNSQRVFCRLHRIWIAQCELVLIDDVGILY